MVSSGLVPRFRRSVAVAALTVLAAACVPDDALIPHVPSSLDAALADVTHPALDQVAATFSGFDVVTPTIVPARCPFESASQSFVCAPLSGGGLTLTQRFALLDARGGKQAAFDPATTTALHLENAVTGTRPESGASVTVDAQQTLDLTGLGLATHTLNGTSITRKTFVDPALGDVSANTYTRKTIITDLVLPVVTPGQPVGWPLSGTIDFRELDKSGELIPSDFTMTMRFNGSSVVTMTSIVPGGIATCQINIAIMLAWGCPIVGPPGRCAMGCGNRSPANLPALHESVVRWKS